MKEVHLNDADFCKEMKAVFLSNFPVVIFEFSGVYGLLAPNNSSGINALNKAKSRLNHKYYGSLLGDFSRCKEIFSNEFLLDELTFLKTFQGSIIRVPVKSDLEKIIIVHEGKHQILIENQLVQDKIAAFEKLIHEELPQSDFFLYPYLGPLCTSANISGDPSGGIKELSKARAFARDRKIPLLVHTDLLSDKLGSYPVFSLTNTGYSLERNGPNSDLISSKADLYYANFGM